MVAKLRDPDLVPDFFVNNTVFGIDPTRPITLERVLERFRFSYSAAGVAHDLFNQ